MKLFKCYRNINRVIYVESREKYTIDKDLTFSLININIINREIFL